MQPLFDSQWAQLVPHSTKHRIPVMSSDRETLRAGGLISFWVEESELYNRVPVFIGRILKGANPADMPVEQPTKFSPALNPGTARRFGMAMPKDFVVRAEEILD